MFLIFKPKYQILTDLGKMETEKIANEQTRPGLSFEKKMKTEMEFSSNHVVNSSNISIDCQKIHRIFK